MGRYRTAPCRFCGSQGRKHPAAHKYLCRRCAQDLTRWIKNLGEQALARRLSHYNLSKRTFVTMVIDQRGLCAICGNGTRMLVIDHDHMTGRVRGLLCSQCNTAIGLLQDDPTLLSSAGTYLQCR
ncbi:MAG: endonuclease VII domain-containing protein [Actinomycetota bacterium]